MNLCYGRMGDYYASHTMPNIFYNYRKSSHRFRNLHTKYFLNFSFSSFTYLEKIYLELLTVRAGKTSLQEESVQFMLTLKTDCRESLYRRGLPLFLKL